MAVLSGSEIERRQLVGGGEEVFRQETWHRERLRGAAYDLRIATDLLILPDGTRYWPGGGQGNERRLTSFILEPKDVAFVSSVEDLCMPLDLAANVAPRFRRALQGLLVMGGLLVDPGYNGRLHFQLANIGDKPIEIEPERTSVAAIQFMPVEGDGLVAEQRVPSSEGLLDDLFRPQEKDPLPPLAFFSDVGELEVQVGDLGERVSDQGIKLDSTKRSTDQIVVFGVFLLSITLFTVAIASLIEALASGSTSTAAEAVANADVTSGLSHEGVIATVALLVLVAIFCVTAMGGAFYLLKPRKKETESKESKDS